MSLKNRIRSQYLKHRLALAAKTQPICFTHVPKCGGISITRSIAAQSFTLRQRLILSNFNIDLVASQNGAAALDMPMMALRIHALAYNLGALRCKFAAGHVPAPPALVKAFTPRWRFVTVLREPVSRWISAFVYNSYKPSDWSKVRDDIDTYLSTDSALAGGQTYVGYFSSAAGGGVRRDLTPDHPLIDEAVENLGRYALVGGLDDLEGWKARYAEIFGVRLKIPRSNETPNREAVARIRGDAALMARIEALCAPDIAVWRRAVLDKR